MRSTADVLAGGAIASEVARRVGERVLARVAGTIFATLPGMVGEGVYVLRGGTVLKKASDR